MGTIDTPMDGLIFALGTYALTLVIGMLVAGMIWLMTRIISRKGAEETPAAAKQ